MDQLTIRLEAARIAAQVEGVTTRNFISAAKRIERYIRSQARLPEHVTMEDITRETVRNALDELNATNDAIRAINDMETGFFKKYKECTLPQDNICKTADAYTTSPYPNAGNSHDPSFASNIMKTFTNYPSITKDFNEAARHRHELYHDLGLEAEPFDKRHPNHPCDTARETVYLAPGGMPSSEAERIYLQDSDDYMD